MLYLHLQWSEKLKTSEVEKLSNKNKNLSSINSTVSIVKFKGKDKEAIGSGFNRFLESFGGIKNIVPVGTKKVLIKPNLMMGEHWSSGITVHPYIIELLARAIKDKGFDVIVGEGAGWGCNSEESFKVTGVDKICRRLDIPLIDFKRGKGIQVQVADGLVLKDMIVDEIVQECDFIISLAKLKTHCETIVSLSLKNMKGVIAEDKERLRFHLLDVNRCLVDLNKVFKPHFSIIEGIVALEGIGPLLPGKPKPMGILVGGRDPVSVDAVCVKIMGLEPGEIRHIQIAAEQGLGQIDIDKIEIIGENLKSVLSSTFKTPPLRIEDLSPFKNIKINAGNPCSNCIASLASYLHGYIDKSIIDKATHNVDILIGAKSKSLGTGTEIAIGNCLKRYRGKIPFVSGCPPPSDAYLKLIERGLKGDFNITTVDSDGKIVTAMDDQE